MPEIFWLRQAAHLSNWLPCLVFQETEMTHFSHLEGLFQNYIKCQCS